MAAVQVRIGVSYFVTILRAIARTVPGYFKLSRNILNEKKGSLHKFCTVQSSVLQESWLSCGLSYLRVSANNQSEISGPSQNGF